MIDREFWAIKMQGRNGLVANKYGRTLWKIKPTNVMDSLRWKAGISNRKIDIGAVKVKVTEIKDD
tara:strand:+ start:227 stop:421 length:195 start_codon:yes stop_codon:yes gene_type:complete